MTHIVSVVAALAIGFIIGRAVVLSAVMKVLDEHFPKEELNRERQKLAERD